MEKVERNEKKQFLRPRCKIAVKNTIQTTIAEKLKKYREKRRKLNPL